MLKSSLVNNLKMEVYMFYVARDKNGELYMYSEIPTRGKSKWNANGCDYMEISNDMFPNVQWEDDPVHVGLVRINS